MAINKVVLTNDDGTTNTLIDLTADTITASDMLSGVIAHDASGAQITGTMPNIGAVSATIDPGDSYTIPKGYHDGTGVVTANQASALGITHVNFNSQLSSSTQTSTSSVLDVGEAGNEMCYGGSLFNRASTYTGTLTLQGSQNNSNWTDIRSVTRSSGGQTSFNGTDDTYRYYRLRLGNSKSNNIACGMMMVCINLGGSSINSIDPIEEDI